MFTIQKIVTGTGTFFTGLRPRRGRRRRRGCSSPGDSFRVAEGQAAVRQPRLHLRAELERATSRHTQRQIRRSFLQVWVLAKKNFDSGTNPHEMHFFSSHLLYKPTLVDVPALGSIRVQERGLRSFYSHLYLLLSLPFHTNLRGGLGFESLKQLNLAIFPIILFCPVFLTHYPMV